MNRSRLKYKQFCTALLLLFYLVGNFSLPLFEGVHFLMHLGDDTTLHSFQSHDTQHQHFILNNFGELVNSSSSTDLPVKNTFEKKLKKMAEPSEAFSSRSTFDLLVHTTNYHTPSFTYPIPFIPINSPPPKV
ncbi:MAG: hypothetical protein AB8G86_10105 [Saprospiraceae bacterium]